LSDKILSGVFLCLKALSHLLIRRALPHTLVLKSTVFHSNGNETKEKKMKDVRVFARITPEQHKELLALADASERTISSLIRIGIENAILNSEKLIEIQTEIGRLLEEIEDSLTKLKDVDLGGNPVLDDLYVDLLTSQAQLNKINLELISISRR